MKTIWNKVPAWIKAIIVSLVIAIPVATVIQLIIIFNLKSNTGWGWALLIAIPLLILFWKLVQRFSSFTKPEDVKIKMNLNWSDKKVWFRIVGLAFAVITTIELSSIAFGSVPEAQIRAGSARRVSGLRASLRGLYGNDPVALPALLLHLVINKREPGPMLYHGGQGRRSGQIGAGRL